MTVNYYIWDFDGTLYDTYPHTLAAFCETVRRHGMEIDRDEAYRQFKITMWEAFRYYGVDDAFIADFYDVENDLSFRPLGVPFPGIPEILRYIAANGGRNYLYTHRDRVALDYLARDGLTDLFSGFVTKENGFPLKPAPDALNWLMREYALDPARCLMIGDRPIDIGAGHAAGVAGCLFDPESLAAGTDCEYRCGDTRALYSLVQKRLKNV